MPLKRYRGYKAECPVCGSFWDLDSLATELPYTASYPILRSHYDQRIGESKVKSLQAWLQGLAIDVSSLTVCEVGFGGGYCLKFLQEKAGIIFGIETIEENIYHAFSLGINKGNLFLADYLPAELPLPVDLWIFLDSFEHLPDPATFMNWVYRNSSKHAQMMIVTPEAGSYSERLLGRLWPHKLSDHRFHWTRKGLVAFLSLKQFDVLKFFRPSKFISLLTIVSHLVHKTGAPKSFLEWIERVSLPNLRFRFNIGEMGVLLRKQQWT